MKRGGAISLPFRPSLPLPFPSGHSLPSTVLAPHTVSRLNENPSIGIEDAFGGKKMQPERNAGMGHG